MLSNITNSKRPTSAISVKFALILLVASLVFAGILTTATVANSPVRDSGNHSTVHRQNTSKATNNNFLASLRFWEKNKAAESPRVPVETRSIPEPPVGSRNTPVGQPGSPASQSPVTPGLAPEPPPTPLVSPRASAPMPGWSINAHDTQGNDAPATHDSATSRTVSHVSYSFDTRDWVEFFPRQQDTKGGTVTAIQATSLHSQVLPSPAPLVLVPQTDESEDESRRSYWDGHATKVATIATIREEINRLQHAPTTGNSVPVTTAHPTMIPAAKPQIDLSPSYQSRLQYVQTCGMVVVQANFPLTEIASILDEINALQHDITRYTGIPAAKEKIELCLFRDESSYLDFLREFFPRAPRDRRALYVKLDDMPGTLMVQKSKEFEVDLRHEMTHAIIHASIAVVPIWLDEGLAKYFEVPPQDRANGHPYQTYIRFNARLGNIPSLDRLSKLATIDDMGIKEYREAWAWTHFLIHHSPETHRLLAAYLQMLANWNPKETKNGGTSHGLFTTTLWDGGTREPIPSLKLYLDDIMPNQRESFREYFGARGK